MSAPTSANAPAALPWIELITTGSELMSGRILNSHHQWICRQLADCGYSVRRQTAVADTAPDIEQAVMESLARADWVITTGGLGPTSDDLTRERVAGALGRRLREDPGVLRGLADFFARRGRPVPTRALSQALVPEGAVVLPNAHGTAPGLVIELFPNPVRSGGRRSCLIMLPGPPRELRPMFRDQVLPLLDREYRSAARVKCRVLRTTGIPESILEETISEPLRPLIADGLEVGYYSRPGEVDLRLVGWGEGAGDLVERAEGILLDLIQPQVFGRGDDEIEAVVVGLLREGGRTGTTAESCTGGLLADRLTDVPGASAAFLGGWVAYSNDVKQRQLGVNPETLRRMGAVSEEVAREMAEGARRRAGADYALAITGIAGPEGGTAEKPVGTVYLALAGPTGTEVERRNNPFDRRTFKRVTTQQALDMLRRSLLSSRTM